MAPKFRGDTEDWLDSDQSGRRAESSAGRRKKTGNVAEGLKPEEANATVAEVFPNQSRVRFDGTGHEALCRYRRANVWGHYRAQSEERLDEEAREKLLRVRERAPVAVGDRVKAELIGGPQSKDGVIEGVCRRRNRLVRPAPARDETILHVLAANVDVLVIVASVTAPEFTPGLVDRFLIAAATEGIEPILVINKIGLLPAGAPRTWANYEALGYQLIEVCAKTGAGLEKLQPLLQGKTVVFSGKSGVGKTSVLRKMTGMNDLRVGEVSDATGKGRHTTTSALLLPIRSEVLGGSAADRWIDTPGIREFGLIGVSLEKLRGFFPEFSGAGCANSDCLHLEEEGCAVKTMSRYESYRRIYQSLASGEN
jgi:ribosome biogenesis GTPase